MIKVKVEGKGARLVGSLIAKALRDSGVEANYWHDVTPRAIPSCRRAASRDDAAVSIVAMTR